MAAISTKRTIYRESHARRFRYIVPMILGCFFLFRGPRLSSPFDVRIIQHTNIIDWVSVVLCVVGMLFSFWARATIGRNWSGIVTLKENHELIVRGPYAFVRHPIYTGFLAMFLATALLYGRLAGILAVLLVFVSFWIKLRDEEEIMLKQFPDQYPAYQQRVKRIIPYLW